MYVLCSSMTKNEKETSTKKQENLGSNEMLFCLAVEPEEAEAGMADRPPVASLRKKHSIGKSTAQQGTLPAAPRIAYSYQVPQRLTRINHLTNLSYRLDTMSCFFHCGLQQITVFLRDRKISTITMKFHSAAKSTATQCEWGSD